MRLTDYLQETDTTLTALAKALDVNLTTLHGYVHYRRNPPVRLVARIEEITNGRVKASDFVKADGSEAA